MKAFDGKIDYFNRKYCTSFIFQRRKAQNNLNNKCQDNTNQKSNQLNNCMKQKSVWMIDYHYKFVDIIISNF
jgi:hypothetical protein